MTILQPDTRVTYLNPYLVPSRVKATVIAYLRDDIYQIKLRENCQMLDPQTGELFIKSAGEIMYSHLNQLEMIPENYITFYTNQLVGSQEIERQLQAFVDTHPGWELEIVDIPRGNWPCIYVNTSQGTYVGRTDIEAFLEKVRLSSP